MANCSDEDGVNGKSCTEEEVVNEKKQDIIEDGGIKTKFRGRAVEKEVKPMTHIFVVGLFSIKWWYYSIQKMIGWYCTKEHIWWSRR